ncbi:MAG: NAD(P)-binding domain-containing protein [Candidatus Sericytochromatia bacterium]
MKISIIGAGNVGKALATGLSKAEHEIFLGIRDTDNNKLEDFLESNKKISVLSIDKAIEIAEVIIISTPPDAVLELANKLKNVKDKIIIDSTNSVFKKPEPYKNAFEILKTLTDCEHIVKCFNTTGAENMENPNYGNFQIDMFVAGNSVKGKNIAIELSKDIGFDNCYDVGGDDKVELMESFAMFWINLAILQKQGRNIAFKLLKR